MHDLSLLHSIQTGSGAHPASYPVGNRVMIFQGGAMRQRREADHLPEVKNIGASSWHKAELFKHKDNEMKTLCCALLFL
jgi:hypothetical protein